MTECAGECKVWQLRQISMLLEKKKRVIKKQFQYQISNELSVAHKGPILPPSPDTAEGEACTLWNEA